MGLFDDVDVATPVVRSEARLKWKKPARPSAQFVAVQEFVQKVPDGKAIFSAEIANAFWDHPNRAKAWPKVSSRDGLKRAIGIHLRKLGFNKNEKGAFIITHPLPEATLQVTSTN
jgi:hypothetical protein